MDLTGKELIAFYGTLRSCKIDGLEYLFTTKIPGVLYNIGPFPALKEEEGEVVAEVYAISDEHVLEDLDFYEGYRPGTDTSLYVRKKVPIADVEGTEAWVYVYNRETAGFPVIESGDWFRRD